MTTSRADTSGAKRRGTGREVALTEIDLRILDLLCAQRVLTSAQLAALLPETPARTLRYRCNRLAGDGLLGRTRPYRERGSAPHHLWPTRRGEALISGEPPPRGGERREPNPLFLAHAAGLSEIYVALETSLPDDAELIAFEREAEARETFEARLTGEGRAIAPDAFIEIAAADGRRLLAFIELDMGTMSHRQLKKKAAGYGEYGRAGAWRERHRFCPALLFVTTTEKRARSFLSMSHKEVGRYGQLVVCVCDLARRLGSLPTGTPWLVDEEGEPRNLLGALGEARRPYDEEIARREAERRREDEERERLRTDPEALRSHLREWNRRNPTGKEDSPRVTALKATVERTGEMNEIECEGLLAFGALLADPLAVRSGDREATPEEKAALDRLFKYRRSIQREQVDDLRERCGDGPALRRADKRIAAGEVLYDRELEALRCEAEGDGKAHAEQERLRDSYLAWREEEARRLAKAQGLLGRVRNRPRTFLDGVDRRALRRCKHCEEIAYPDAETTRGRHVAERCHYCGVVLPDPGPAEEYRPC